MEKTSFTGHFILRNFIVFLFAVIFSTTSMGIAYFGTIKSLETNLERNNLNSVIQMKDIIEERLNKILYTINYLGSDYQTNYILNLPYPLGARDPMDIIYARNYMDYIGSLTFANDLIAELSVYSVSSDRVFTSTGVKSLSYWYESTFTDNNDTYSDQNLEEWRQLLDSNSPSMVYPAQYSYSKGAPTKVIPMIQKLPLGSKKRNIGNVCVLIHSDILFHGFKDTITYGNWYITNDSSEILYTFHEVDFTDYPIELPNELNGSFIKIIDQENQIVTYARSKEGLVFVTITPYSVVMSQANNLKNIFYIMILLSFGACILAAILLLCKINKPVKHLLHDNEDLKHRLKEQTKQVQVSLLCRLLTGFYSNKEELLLSLGYVGIDPSTKVYNVVHITIQTDGQQDMIDYLTIKAQIRSLIGRNDIYVVDTGLDCISLIWEFPNGDVHKNKHEISSVIKEIQTNLLSYGVSILAGCGCFYEDITQVRNSYTEAVFALKNRISQNNDSINWYNEQNLVPIFHYPLELEQKILVNTRCGDYEAIEEAIDEIYNENYIQSNISDNMGDLLTLRIKTTLLNASSEIRTINETIYQEIVAFIFTQTTDSSREDVFIEIKRHFEVICRIASMSQILRNNQLKHNLLEFIDNHCYKPDLCLTMVADNFGISDTYLSSFFKEQTGVNFINYIETKRLTKACSLLKDQSLTIEAIAKEVGYTSAHSFRRAFKRNYGITPANYQP